MFSIVEAIVSRTPGLLVAKEEEPADALERSVMFGALSAEGRRKLARAGVAMILERGGQLFARGDSSDCCYILVSGGLEVTVVNADGHETWFAALVPVTLIGEMAMLDGGVRSATITATRPSRLLRIGREKALDALRAEPEAILAVTMLLARKLRAADALAEDTATIGLTGRLARLLLQHGNRPVAIPQEEMARLIGASTERVGKTISEWRGRGIVEVGRSGLKVLDHARLAEMVRIENMI